METTPAPWGAVPPEAPRGNPLWRIKKGTHHDHLGYRPVDSGVRVGHLNSVDDRHHPDRGRGGAHHSGCHGPRHRRPEDLVLTTSCPVPAGWRTRRVRGKVAPLRGMHGLGNHSPEHTATMPSPCCPRRANPDIAPTRWGRQPSTERPNGTALPRRAAVPDATFRSPRAKPTAEQRVTRPWSPSDTETGSSADQVGAEFAVQQIHQRLPVLGGRFGWPQVRLRLVDRAEDSNGGVPVAAVTT